MAKSPSERSPGRGHNVAGVASDRLRSLVDRIERLNEERKAITGDISEIYLEARVSGFDTKALRRLIAIRKRDPDEVEEEEVLVATYSRALDVWTASTPEDFEELARRAEEPETPAPVVKKTRGKKSGTPAAEAAPEPDSVFDMPTMPV